MNSESVLRPATVLVLALAAVFVAVGAGCGGSSAGAGAVASNHEAEPVASEPQAVPETTPQTTGEWLEAHARWVAEALSAGAAMPGVEALGARFTPEFVAVVPAASLRALLLTLSAGGPRRFVEWLEPPREDAPHGVALIGGEGGYLRVGVAVDPARPELIAGLRLTAAPELDPSWVPAASWAELDAELATMASRVGFIAAEIDEAGACTTIHGLDATTPRAMGSAFKLYVLAALADAVYAGEHAWDELLAVREEAKSLPTGRMHTEAAGASFALRDWAEAMISISDNTATDHLIDLLGRDAIEAAVVRAGHADPALLRPFLLTREVFWLKILATPDVRARYQAGDEAARRAILEEEIAFDFGTAMFGAGFWTAPRALDIEWYMSPEDACRVMAYIRGQARAHGDETALDVLAVNPALMLDGEVWPYVGYKGGSEPGVLGFDWLLQRADGRWFVLSAAFNDDERALTDAIDPPLLAMRAATLLLAGE